MTKDNYTVKQAFRLGGKVYEIGSKVTEAELGTLFRPFLNRNRIEAVKVAVASVKPKTLFNLDN